MLLPSPKWDIMSPSFRLAYLSLLPSLLILVLPPVISLLAYLLPRPARRYLIDIPYSYVGPFLTLHDQFPPDKRPKRERPRWKTILLACGALAQLQHVVLGSWKSDASDPRAAGSWILAFLLGACWFYAAAWPVVIRRRSTPKTALLAFYVVQLVVTSLTFLTWLYARNVHPATPRLSTVTIVSTAAALVVDLVLIGVTLSMPIMELPEAYVQEQEKLESDDKLGYSPEDRTTVGGWLTFGWVHPLIVLGRGGYLKDADLWDLSPVSKSSALHAKFALSSNLSLIHRLAKANGMDILLDAGFAFAAIILNYAAPFLVKRIIEALGDPTRERLSEGYVLATLALACSLLKAQMDLNHLWRGRRGAIRSQSEISAAIFAKVLVAKDASGVAEGKGASGTGKIIQLMSNDGPSVSRMLPALFMIYGAPLELLVCCTFLYWILSWSAFVGIAAICLLMPLQGWLTSLAYSIYHEYRKVADERSNLLTEIVNSIKVIKFFGWEKHYLSKADSVRGRELWLSVKQSIVSLVFSLSGTLTPLIVTVVSFFSYVYIQKRELTVAVAFTAMSLFGMLQSPLAGLPMWVVHISQTVASAKRVDAYLHEDEIADGVSSLKSAPLALSATAPSDTRIGFVGGARFKWNAGKVDDKVKAAETKDKNKSKNKNKKNSTEVDVPAPVSEEPARVFELGDISFLFPAGALTIISGPTGGGKTALLHALLGEMDCTHGSIALPKDMSRFDEDGLTNSVAYAGQTAWLQNLSIKGNILFGSSMDEPRYEAVLKACSLLPDLKILEDGDDTEIGSKGVSLSGGQKARVALARAIYSRAKHVLLDDPLAAVDSHTAAALVSDCLASPLLKDRTVIIVSHHVELLLPIAHSIVHIVDGRVEASGTIAELRANGHLGEIVAEEEKAHVEEKTVVDEAPAAEEGVPKVKKAARKMTEDEDRSQGSVGLQTYGLYLSAASWTCVAAIGVLMLISDNAMIGERWWISIWTRPTEETVRALVSLAPRSLVSSQHAFSAGSGEHHSAQAYISSPSRSGTVPASWESRLPVAKDHPLWYLGIYTAIALGFVMLDLVRNLIGYLGKYRASKKLHSQLVRSIMRATPRWFDVTPTGRILNRVTKDIGTIDSDCLDMIVMTARSLASVAGSLVLILVVLPKFAIPGVLIGYVYYKLTVAYLRCGRDLQRIKAVTLSPILSGFDSTLIGIVTIRAFSAEKRFLDEFHGQQDTTTAAEWWIWMCNRWLLYRFDAIGAFTTYTAIILVLYTETSAALGGMIILSSANIMMSIYWMARFFSEMEMSMNSVERVKEYLHIPQEARLEIPESAPPAYWPSNSGDALITVEDLVVAYDPSLPPVIHGVSFDVKPREKIGLIGRTGSGKSTLGLSFLRSMEATSGRILIDGIDISTLGLQKLREKVTIVPQDAVLFSGTVRSNLDPFKEHTDEELNDILHRVQLGLPSTSTAPSRVASSSNVAKLDGEGDVEDALKANSVASTGKITVTLDSEVSSGGQNFSQGQRQLIALGRALVRANNILIMDEATASVDFETDNLIQQTIREEFSNSALITIAHRLSSIIDYDRLVVLDAGRIVEFDTPYNLLSKKANDDKAVFLGMVQKSGKFDELFASAEKKAKSG